MLAILHYILDTFWSAASLFPLSNICRTASHPPREPLPSHYAAAATPGQGLPSGPYRPTVATK